MTALRERRNTYLPPRGWLRRTQRFDVKTAIRYRRTGEAEWHEGVTLNISASGVLFHAGELIEPRTAVEMKFALPRGIPGQSAAQVKCKGQIVRNVAGTGLEKAPAMAATITRYRFLRGEGAWGTSEVAGPQA